MTQQSHPFAPGWADRISEKAKSLGFGSLCDFLANVPSVPYKEVARRLGVAVAPLQIVSVQFRESRTQKRVREAAKDCLCRNIVQELPDGWGTGANANWQSILALSSWSSSIEVTGECDYLHAILKSIANSLMHVNPPPSGWLPIGSNDPVIMEVFDACWPEAAGGHPTGSCDGKVLDK